METNDRSNNSQGKDSEGSRQGNQRESSLVTAGGQVGNSRKVRIEHFSCDLFPGFPVIRRVIAVFAAG